MSVRGMLPARKRKYREILRNFLGTGKGFQIVTLENESPRDVKVQLDSLISHRGWRGRVIVLEGIDSITLINLRKSNQARLKGS
jgi:hypothetical protein